MAARRSDEPKVPALLSDRETQEIAKSIWQLTEEVLELLRSRSTRAVSQEKKPQDLWLDELTETQSRMVVAVRQLCEDFPEGIGLKRLAEVTGVTSAAASVVVETLVRKRMLRRSRSKTDRRMIHIRLSPVTSHLFDISDSTLIDSFAAIKESLGGESLGEWRATLVTVTEALRSIVDGRAPSAVQTEGSAEQC